MTTDNTTPLPEWRLAEIRAMVAAGPLRDGGMWRDLLIEAERLRAERADLLAHLRPEALLDLSLAEDVTCDCADDSREHAPDCPRGLLYYLTTLAEKLEKEAAQ